MTKAIIPTFQAGDWTVQGKTGSTRLGNDADSQDKRSLGWFVGWAKKDGRQIVFARLVVDTKRTDMPKGLSDAGGVPEGPAAADQIERLTESGFTAAESAHKRQPAAGRIRLLLCACRNPKTAAHFWATCI